MIKISNYINGKLENNNSNCNYIDIFNPSIGEVYAQCQDSSKRDLNNAIKSAENSFLEWSEKKQKYRSDFLFLCSPSFVYFLFFLTKLL